MACPIDTHSEGDYSVIVYGAESAGSAARAYDRTNAYINMYCAH